MARTLLEEREGFLGGRWGLLRKRNLSHQLGAWKAKEPLSWCGVRGMGCTQSSACCFYHLGGDSWAWGLCLGLSMSPLGSQLPGGDAGVQLQWQSMAPMQELSADPSVPVLL